MYSLQLYKPFQYLLSTCKLLPDWSKYIGHSLKVLSNLYVLWWCSFMHNFLILFSTKSLHTLGAYHTSAFENLNFKSLKLGRQELVATKFRLQVVHVDNLCKFCGHVLCFSRFSFDVGIFYAVPRHNMSFHLNNVALFYFKQYEIKNLA
jgi:hypothetical protein